MTSHDSKRLIVACVQDSGVKKGLRGLQCNVETVASAKKLLTTNFSSPPSLFLVQAVGVTAEQTRDLIRSLKHQRPLTDVIIWAPKASGSLVRTYFLESVKDVVVSPSSAVLVDRIEQALDEQQLMPRVNDLGRRRGKGARFESMLSRSAAMWDLFDLCSRIAPTEATVLIIGETGTGKELLARAVHRRSGRSGRFVAANCASIPPELINSELFGHEKGAFTGADRQKQGLVAHANEGTLFLDEVGDMPPEGQLSLLRMLQEMRIRPVGSLVETKVDVRVIAATNVPLDEAVHQGDFREDLFYRLDVIRMNVPPLRQRPEDILFLFGNFIKRLAKEYGVDPPLYADSFLDALIEYDWPGNIRQLENFCERLVLARPQRALNAKDFAKLRSSSLAIPMPVQETARGASADGLAVDPSVSLKENVDRVIRRVERRYMESVLKQTSGRVADAATVAGISRRTLLRKMKALGVNKNEFKKP